MQILKGIGIAKGLALGYATYIKTSKPEIPSHTIGKEELDAEITKLEQALDQSREELNSFLQQQDVSESEKEILSTHLEILTDPELIQNLNSAINDELHNVAKAIHTTFEEAIDFFHSMENEIFAQRAADFADVRMRLLRKVMNHDPNPFSELNTDSIPIFTEISPSDVSLLSKQGVCAYIAENCSATSHAAILSRALNIACVAHIPELKETVHEGDYLIVDGGSGEVILNPDDEALDFYAQKLQIQELIEQKQLQLKNTECQTKTGALIDLALNIGLPEEIDLVSKLNSSGVGLFRTEFLFISKEQLPSEEEQYQIYSKMADQIAPKTLTIRTFDMGGDKLSHLIPAKPEANPYLGNRGIRFSLAHPELLRTQLKAILRAAKHGKICIMFPMIVDVDDFLEAKRIFLSCADELYAEGISYSAEIPIGTMIEIPSAALSSDALARECDFLSIGTNDLVQYTLAVDRNNESVSRYYIQHHPAVLKLIRATLVNAAKYNTPVSICGEMASIREYIPLLIGMGATNLSVNASAFFDVKSVIQRCDAKVNMIVKNFDFSTSLPKVDELVYRTLKPYYEEKKESYK